MSKNRFQTKCISPCTCGYRFDGIRRRHDILQVRCIQRLALFLLAWKRVLDSDIGHENDCSLWSVRHSFVQGKRRQIEITWLEFLSGTCFITDDKVFSKSSIEWDSMRKRVHQIENSARKSRGRRIWWSWAAAKAPTDEGIEASPVYQSRACIRHWSKQSRAVG